MNPAGSIPERLIPQITTWRLESQRNGSDGVLRETFKPQPITEINASQANMKMDGGFTYYEYSPSPPTTIQAGDIVGIMMPSDDDARAQSCRPLFLRLPEGNASSCVFDPGSNFQQIILVNGMCINPQDQQSEYLPLVSAIFSELPNHLHC